MSADEPDTSDLELGERYLRGELDERQRDAFERRLLEEDALFEDVRALELSAEALRGPTPVVRVRRAAPAWLGWAAALLLSLPAALWIKDQARPRPLVTRASQEAQGPVAVEALLDVAADAPSTRLPRARTLVSLPAPELGTGDVLSAELYGPRGERPVAGLVLSVVAGRARLLVDARGLSSGPWRLALRWSDASGRALGARDYELRVE